MKTYCKNVDPSDIKTIEKHVFDALSSKLKRKDYSEFAAGYCGLSGKEIRAQARAWIKWYPELESAVRRISLHLREDPRQGSLPGSCPLFRPD